MELINEIRFSGHEYYNELTREMDKHLEQVYKESLEHFGWDGTYICEKDVRPNFKNDVYAIRYPGATRGHIEVDENNCIVSILLYDTAVGGCVGCYENSVNDIFDKYIGAKIIEYKDSKFFPMRVEADGHGGIAFMEGPSPRVDLELNRQNRKAVIVEVGSGSMIREAMLLTDQVRDAELDLNNFTKPSKSMGKRMAMLLGITSLFGGDSLELFDDFPEPKTGKCSRSMDGKCSYFKRPCKGEYRCNKFTRRDY